VGKVKVYPGHCVCALNTTDLPHDNPPTPHELLGDHIDSIRDILLREAALIPPFVVAFGLFPILSLSTG
jgi:hypothetical protein